jgi:hypothetical protein
MASVSVSNHFPRPHENTHTITCSSRQRCLTVTPFAGIGTQSGLFYVTTVPYTPSKSSASRSYD